MQPGCLLLRPEPSPFQIPLTETRAQRPDLFDGVFEPGTIAELEVDGHGTEHGEELGVRVTDRLAQPDQFDEVAELLVEPLGEPDRADALGEHERQCLVVAQPAGHRQGLIAQREHRLGVARVLDLDRQIGEQLRPQRIVRGRQLVEHLAQQPDALDIDRSGRGGGPRLPASRAWASTRGSPRSTAARIAAANRSCTSGSPARSAPEASRVSSSHRSFAPIESGQRSASSTADM